MQPEPLMLVCVWCGYVMRLGTAPASHGICRGCADLMEERLKKEEQACKTKQ